MLERWFGVNASAIVQVWRRNALVWRKLAAASLMANVIDPVMALMAFGLGVGSLVNTVEGQPYLQYLAVGAVCISAMNAPTFESLYSAFSRMQVQKTWQSIMNTPVRLREVVLGECFWAAAKGCISTACMMVVLALLGVGDGLFWLMGWCVLALACVMYAALGLCVNARAPSYDFFMFYFTLVITPQTFLSGAFFPRSQFPEWLQWVAQCLPLSLVVDCMRALHDHRFLAMPALLLGMMVYTALGLWGAVQLSERRFAKAS
ncbi:MAG TPA: ABC transporter permease [Limnobacter sp.]|uniref:ABC transporter permease n=1 Tax=Limnobacter sp. TaxID=2003368 RepID=UPI002ED8286F